MVVLNGIHSVNEVVAMQIRISAMHQTTLLNNTEKLIYTLTA